MDLTNNQILAIAEPKQHDMLRKALSQLVAGTTRSRSVPAAAHRSRSRPSRRSARCSPICPGRHAVGRGRSQHATIDGARHEIPTGAHSTTARQNGRRAGSAARWSVGVHAPHPAAERRCGKHVAADRTHLAASERQSHAGRRAAQAETQRQTRRATATTTRHPNRQRISRLRRRDNVEPPKATETGDSGKSAQTGTDSRRVCQRPGYTPAAH